MGLLETFRTAFESLFANKLRSALTMLGVIIGVMSVVTLLALGSGVQNYVNQRITSIGTNLLSVSTDNSVAGAKRLTNDDVEALSNPANVPDLRRVVAQVNGNLNVVVGTTSKTYAVVGTVPDNFPMRNIAIEQGEPFTLEDNENRMRVAIIGYQIALDLFPEQVALGQTILINSVPFRVVGVTEKKGTAGPPGSSSDDTVYVPLTVGQEKLFVNRPGGLKSVNSITAEALSSDRSAQAMQDIANTLRAQHNIIFGQPDDFRIFDQAAVISTLNTVISALQAFLAAIGAISLLVGGIGIMNIMLVSVTERTREIGVRKAIGAAPGSIRLQFLVESLVVTVLAGAMGVGLATALSYVIGRVQETLTPEIQLSSVLIAFGVSVFIGVIFGFYPAFRASRLPPVEALRYE
jgi:putative ABC transport system permease protein